MSVASKSHDKTGPRDARVVQPSTSPPRVPADARDGRVMSAFDALSVWSAVEFQANRARLSAVQMRVLHAVLNQTVRYQRLSVPISRSRMALLADVHGNNLAACLDVLEMSGFVNHSPGVGRRLTVVTLVVPEDWERHEQDAGGDPGPRAQATPLPTRVPLPLRSRKSLPLTSRLSLPLPS